MTPSRRTPAVAQLVTVLLLLAIAAGHPRRSLGALQPSAESQHDTLPPTQVRALWVARTSLISPADIDRMVHSARAAGFNTILVQVRGRGDAYFTAGVEPRATALDRQPAGFDPLATTLALAHAAGMRVHAWINVNLASDARGSMRPDHIVLRHPEWLMVPRELAGTLGSVSPRDPRYLEALRRWTRTQSRRVEGLYMSPIPPGSTAHTVSVVSDLIDRYDVDGVHLDYVRYPNEFFDYSAGALEAFQRQLKARLTPAEREWLDARRRTNRFADADLFPHAWADFRRDSVTALVAAIRRSLRSRRPHLQLSAAVYPEPDEARGQKFQDWPAWLEAGLLDVVCPMAYAPDGRQFIDQIRAARRGAAAHPMWVGIGAYRLSFEQTVENVRTARRLGADGIVLFSYDSLTAPQPGRVPLTAIGRAAFGE